MLIPRIFTALVLVALLITGLEFASTQTLMLGFGVAVVIGYWEWTQMMGVRSMIWRSAYCVLCAAALWVLFPYIYEKNVLKWILAAAMIWWLLAILLVIKYPKITGPITWPRVASAIAGAMILVPAWLALGYLHQLGGQGLALIYLIFLIVISADVGAYFVGRAIGKHKLAKQVSPGKTMEGGAGALVFSQVVGLLFIHFNSHLSFSVEWIGIILITAVVSIFGDLFESLSKRASGIKDSGKILPGHGGIMDRLDSLSAAIPVFATGIVWWIQIT